MVLQNTRLVCIKHPEASDSQSILQNRSIYLILQKYFVSKQGLRAYLGNPDRVLGGSCDKNKNNEDANHQSHKL